MKFHVILLASALVLTSGCAFKETGPSRKPSASALSSDGFGGTLSSILEPSIQSVTPTAVSMSSSSGTFTLQVIGTNLGYRGLQDQPNLITAKPLLMSLGDGCECTSNNITASVLPSNQDSLSCVIQKSTCTLGGQNRNLTITRSPLSGEPSTVTSYNSVQFLDAVPFEVGNFSVTCTHGVNGVDSTAPQTGTLFGCRSNYPAVITMSGASGITSSGQLRVGQSICTMSSVSSTGFTCNLPSTCSSSNCLSQNLPVVYSQSGYAFGVATFRSVAPFSVTALNTTIGSATAENTVQITGTNLSANLQIKIGTHLCTYDSNTSSAYFCKTFKYCTDADHCLEPVPAPFDQATITFLQDGYAPSPAPTNLKYTFVNIRRSLQAVSGVDGGPISFAGTNLQTSGVIRAVDGSYTCTSGAATGGGSVYSCNFPSVCAAGACIETTRDVEYLVGSVAIPAGSVVSLPLSNTEISEATSSIFNLFY